MRTAAVCLALFALACRRESSTAANQPTPAPYAQDVQLLEYSIRMPQTLPAGHISFNIENAGKEQHGFEIVGNGIEQKTDALQRGNTASLDVDLKPGTYTVYCPVKGHREKGMEVQVSVR